MVGDILQPTHLVVILLVALLVLGPKRLPEVGRSLGKGIRDFRSAMSGIEEHTSGLLDPNRPAPNASTAPPPTTPVQATAPAESTITAAAAQPPVAAAPAPATAAVQEAAEPDPSEYSD